MHLYAVCILIILYTYIYHLLNFLQYFPVEEATWKASAPLEGDLDHNFKICSTGISTSDDDFAMTIPCLHVVCHIYDPHMFCELDNACLKYVLKRVYMHFLNTLFCIYIFAHLHVMRFTFLDSYVTYVEFRISHYSMFASLRFLF